MPSDSWSIKLVKNLSVVLRKERKAQGLSVYGLAQKSGVSELSINNYERGKRRPTIERLACVSKALGLKTSEIIAIAEENIGQSN